MQEQNEKPDISPIAQFIIDENIAALDDALKNGWKINEPIQTSKYSKDLPIWHALFNNKPSVVNWLISKKVQCKLRLNDKKYPAIIASIYAGKKMIQLMLDNGADINALDHIGRNVVTIALYQKNIDLIPFLVERGYDPKKDGRSLNQAVFGRQFKAVKMLLDLGFDVNFHERDQVHTNNPSAVHIAASNINDFKTVQLLVEHGADITLKDKYGDRPYTAAFMNNDKPLMAYLKALEPAEWHDEALHLAKLAEYQLPESIITLCKQSQKKRTIYFKENGKYGPNWLVMCTPLMVKPLQLLGKTFVDIVQETDNYSNFLFWYPAKNCLAYVDIEHDEWKKLGKWEDFLANPDAFFAKYLSQYF